MRLLILELDVGVACFISIVDRIRSQANIWSMSGKITLIDHKQNRIREGFVGHRGCNFQN
jgi:hypothetical protein